MTLVHMEVGACESWVKELLGLGAGAEEADRRRYVRR